MTDRVRFRRVFLILVAFGLISFVNMTGRPSFQSMRAVDIVQLIGTGMCFGAAVVALSLVLRSPRSG